ncbi:MAG: hypothetical protein HFE92_03590 [Acutalibacter muris]|nr:hypothetical protein [Acutalibacter muris]
MKSVLKKYRSLPEPLRRIFALRIAGGGASLLLSIVIWPLTQNINLAIPFAAISAYLLISGGLLCCRCARGEYLRITGTVKEIITTGIRRRPRYLLIETAEGMIRLPASRKRFPAGSSVALYLHANTPVYEQDGLLRIFTYLALELASPSKKRIDEGRKL